MSKHLRYATGPIAAVLLMVACSDAPEEQYPFAADMAMTPSTATVTIDGMEYQYGCPDYPCPVTQIVKDHIASGKFFMMEPSPFGGPAIYLYVLRIPVKLRVPITPPPPDPPFLKLSPVLDGPDELMGERMGPMNELACRDVGLEIKSMDDREWRFVSAEKTMSVLGWSWGTQSWNPTGTSMHAYVFGAEWSQLEGGHYGLHPGTETTTYDTKFTVLVETGNEGVREEISHTVRCMDPVPPDPLPPYLTGPEYVRGDWQKSGSWWHPQYRLVCSDFDLDLVSPDGGPWAFVPDGTMEVDYLNWNSIWWRWEPHPFYRWPMHAAIGASQWDDLLDGDFTIHPSITESFRSLDGYRATFTATVARTSGAYSWEEEVSHSFKCIAPEVFDWLYD